MKPFEPIRSPEVETALRSLSWIPEEIRFSLSAIVPFLLQNFQAEISQISLYGSWQRNAAGMESDVDIAVFLNHEVGWFEAQNGIVNRRDARKCRQRWQEIEKRAKNYRFDSRDYSIVVVTPGMLDYYAARGPIHLQNWVYALRNSHPLWKG